ncbi:hypothetical protein EC973_003418, partial [Apophysomyces ossiformis]
METRYSHVIAAYINGAVENGRVPSLADFVNNELDFIVQSTEPGEDVSSVWAVRFSSTANALQVQTKNSKPDWGKVALAILKRVTKKKDTTSETSSFVSTSASTSTVSSDSSSSNSPVPLTTCDKSRLKNIYESLEDSKKWTLKTGKKVEDEMLKLAMQCNYQHPSHSFIMDPNDSHWLDYFTKEELDEIKTFKIPTMDDIPSDLHEYLYSYRGKRDLDALFKHRSLKFFHPIEESDLHWAHKAIVEATDLYHYGYMPISTQSEADLLRRVWSFTEKCYDESCIDVRSGEKSSLASSQQKNAGRTIDGIQPMSRKYCGHKMDMLFSYLRYEYGCTEAGVSSDINSSKALREGSIKLARVLKDMFLELVETALPELGIFKQQVSSSVMHQQATFAGSQDSARL